MPGPLLLLEEHVYNEACVLETAVMLSEISIIALAGSKEILSIHHFTVLVISPMRYDPAFSSHRYFAHSRIFQSYSRRPCDMLLHFLVSVNSSKSRQFFAVI